MSHHREYPPPGSSIKHRAGFMLGVFQGRFFLWKMVCELVYCVLLHVRIFLNCALPPAEVNRTFHGFFFSAFDKKQ